MRFRENDDKAERFNLKFFISPFEENAVERVNDSHACAFGTASWCEYVDVFAAFPSSDCGENGFVMFTEGFRDIFRKKVFSKNTDMSE